MNIGILTFARAINFGAQLQAYALEDFISKMDVGNVEMIGFETKYEVNLYSVNPFVGGAKMQIKRLFSLRNRKKQIDAFEKFGKNYLKYSPCFNENDDVKSCFSKYDLIICGSDQIWNNKLTGNLPIYYAWPSESKVRKISYAASFGTNEVTDYQKYCIKEYLSKFDAISVRENNGVGFVNKTIDVVPQVVIDPVFLKSKAEWLRIIDGIQVPTEDYILYYSLQTNERLIKKAEELSTREKLKLYVVHPLGEKQSINGEQLYNVGPLEFVSLIYNAKIVITNSFHATAFSVIFRKKLIHIFNSKSTGRVGTLFDDLGIDKGIEEIDMRDVDVSVLEKKIENSKLFLMNNVQGSPYFEK